jgi:hypothetical protein
MHSSLIAKPTASAVKLSAAKRVPSDDVPESEAGAAHAHASSRKNRRKLIK